MVHKRVKPHRRGTSAVRGHARVGRKKKHFANIATFRGKVKALQEAKPGMSDRMARGIVGKWVKAHEG